MPKQIIMTLKPLDAQGKPGIFLSSLFQGVLMEVIDPDYAEELHQSRVHPYSQNLEVKEEHLIWTVNALNREAEEHILHPLKDEHFQKILLTNKGEKFAVENKEIRELSFRELENRFYLGECNRVLRVQFTTPTSFKTGGRYMIYPTARLLFQSLMKRYDACSEESMIYSDEILDELASSAELIGYRLRSTSFHMEGIKIPSFTGIASVRLHGPQQLVNVAWMLAEFGIFSGVGIKTGAGMGALRILQGQQGGTH